MGHLYLARYARHVCIHRSRHVSPPCGSPPYRAHPLPPDSTCIVLAKKMGSGEGTAREGKEKTLNRCRVERHS